MTSESFEQATEADVAEQQAPAEGAAYSEPTVTSADANEADALEQGADVDEADDLYPHQSESSDDAEG